MDRKSNKQHFHETWFVEQLGGRGARKLEAYRQSGYTKRLIRSRHDAVNHVSGEAE